MKKLLCLVLALLLWSSCFASSLPAPGNAFYWYDEAGVLSAETRERIVDQNRRLNGATGAQIVVAVIKTSAGQDIRDYAYRLFNEWEIGDRALDNGFLLLLAIDDDTYWCTPGRGTGAIITNGELGDMLTEYLEPHFAQKDYSAGVKEFFDRLYAKVSEYYEAHPARGGAVAGRQAKPLLAALWAWLLTRPFVLFALLALIVLLIKGIVKSKKNKRYKKQRAAQQQERKRLEQLEGDKESLAVARLRSRQAAEEKRRREGRRAAAIFGILLGALVVIAVCGLLFLRSRLSMSTEAVSTLVVILIGSVAVMALCAFLGRRVNVDKTGPLNPEKTKINEEDFYALGTEPLVRSSDSDWGSSSFDSSTKSSSASSSDSWSGGSSSFGSWSGSDSGGGGSSSGGGAGRR